MNYYVISPNVWNDPSMEDFFLEIMLNESIVLMGWDKESSGGIAFYNMELGDRILIAQGANRNKTCFYIGQIASESQSYPFVCEGKNLKVNQYRKLDKFKDVRNLHFTFTSDNTYGDSNLIPAIYRLKPENKADLRIIRRIDKLLDEDAVNSNNMNPEVNISTSLLRDLFNETSGICIPDYQRTYCWREKNVYKLLDDIWNIKSIYHLGSLIFQRNKRNHDILEIIDGQQRLITLTLILNELGDECLPLLNTTIESEDAIKYIAYNKYLISNYVARYNLNDEKKKQKIQNIRDNLQFTVLTLEDTSLDLAYTFFSNQNSKGVGLTSYDLLKSHHLRFIPNENENQAIHLSKQWDTILLDKSSYERIDITMGLYLFRMRKWLYDKTWDDKNKFKVKEEFEAAITIPEIPPFGEQFIFQEPIQGGTHFFVYTDVFIKKCKDYHNTESFKSLKYIDGESHKWFREVMEALLFSYFLKFGDSYLSEAFVCISKIISDYRYKNKRIKYETLIMLPENSYIMSLIEQSSSPTFFLAAARNYYNKLPLVNPNQLENIRERYYYHLKRTYDDLKQRSLFKSELFVEEIDG